MNGPSEFHVVGSLKEWSVVDRVQHIRVPTLVVAGAYDEALPIVWQPFVDRVPDVRSHVFAESLPHAARPRSPRPSPRSSGTFLREHD